MFINPFLLNILFLYPLNMSENFWFPNVFRGLEMEHQAKIGLNVCFCESHINDAYRENCILLNSGQEFIEIKAWLLLTSFLCLQYELSFVHFIVTC